MGALNTLNFQFNEESKRLAELYAFKILDTAPELNFDELARLAASICDAPTGLISLVDNDRIWFKSGMKLDSNEVPREGNFCSYAIDCHGVFEIPDALLDSRFCNNPMVRSQPGIRFYAGAPLISPRGMVLGALCVIDYKPNKLNEAQLTALSILASQVVSQMETRRLSRSVNEAQKVIQSQHDIIKMKAKIEAAGIMARKVCEQINHPLEMSTARVALMRSRIAEEKFSQKIIIDNDLANLDRSLGDILHMVEGFQMAMEKLKP
jgi:hypothetical protein